MIGWGSERFAHHFLAFLPESFGVYRVESVSANAFTDGGDGDIVRHDVASVAVLAIAAADFIRRNDDAGPHGGGRSLRDGLPLKGWLALGGELLIDLSEEGRNPAGIHIAAQLGMDAAGVYCSSADAAPFVPLVESDGEENVGGLRAAIGDEGLVRR